MADQSHQNGVEVEPKNRGGSFFVVDRANWEKVWNVETRNRLNLCTAFLVLSAGTGRDHRLTKWSAKACEEYTGMGKPRAKLAIEELINSGLVEHTDQSKRLFPQYRLAEHLDEREPIFLPVQLITGFDAETPILRRVRQTGDAELLRMLVDMYGLVELDPTFGIPIVRLRMDHSEGGSAKKIAEYGANAIWSLDLGGVMQASGEWVTHHAVKKGKTQDWSIFWERVGMLRKIGALYFSPWVFDGEALDSEPIFPVSDMDTDVEATLIGKMKLEIYSAVAAAVEDRSYLLDKSEYFTILPTHHRAPSLRGVARMRVEADTPGRRESFMARKNLIESATVAFGVLRQNLTEGRFGIPISL